MKLANDTITVYNSYTDNIKKYKHYIPTVIRGVHWYGTVKAQPTNSGLVSASEYTIRVPEDADFGATYVSPKTYEKLEDKTGYFTFAKGDTIVHGEIVVPDARPSELQEKYDDVVTIISVTDNMTSPNASHYKVVCK